MLDIFGGENWTPNTNHPGLFKRAGTNHWAIYGWDPNAKSPTGSTATSSRSRTISFDEVLCGSLFGAPAADRADRADPAEPGARRPVTVQSFLQFLIIGLGAGATYALFAQGAVLIYRGSGLVNFAQGAIGTLRGVHRVRRPQGQAAAGRRCPRSSSRWSRPARCRSRSRRSSSARCGAPRAIVRVIATIGLLGLLQAVVAKRYGVANQPVDSYLPHEVWQWGGITVQEERIYLVAITLVVTFGLWAWTRYTRVGLAISASAQNERAVQTLGWSPDRLVRAHLDGRRHARRVRRRARRAAHRAVGDDVHRRGDRGRARCGVARRLPVVPVDAARRVDHRRRRGDGHALRQRHPGLLPPGPDHRAQPHARVPRDLHRGRRARPGPAAAVARGRAVAEARDAARSTSGASSLASAITLVAAVRGDGRRLGAGHVHLVGHRDHDPVDRRADRVRRSDLARAVGARRHRRADRRAVRARRRARRARDRARHPPHDPGRAWSSRSPRCGPAA